MSQNVGPAPTGVKKMKQGMSYTAKEKTIILNVFKYLKQEFPDVGVTEIVRRTARATGCSEKSVFQFRKEEASGGGFREPSKTKVRKNLNVNSRDVKYDSTVRQAIRDVVYDLKCRNVVPSLNTIRGHVNSNERLPNFSLMTLRRLLFDMGFRYEKNGTKAVLVEKNGNDTKRHHVVSQIPMYSENVKPIESPLLLNSHHQHGQCVFERRIEMNYSHMINQTPWMSK